MKYLLAALFFGALVLVYIVLYIIATKKHRYRKDVKI